LPFFRRSKPLHERLAEDGELDIGGGAPPQPPQSRLSALMHGLADGFLSRPPDLFGRPSPLSEVAFHGVARPREWDAVVSTEADLPGDSVHFAALADGTLVVDEDVPDGALTPLAEAVETALRPPYRATGIRKGERIWAVGANTITVRSFPDEREDEVEFVEDDHIVVGRRLDGDLFEVEVTPL
jgi:hypothetical protein